jgi:hypothetical protein
MEYAMAVDAAIEMLHLLQCLRSFFPVIYLERTAFRPPILKFGSIRRFRVES